MGIIAALGLKELPRARPLPASGGAEDGGAGPAPTAIADAMASPGSRNADSGSGSGTATSAGAGKIKLGALYELGTRKLKKETKYGDIVLSVTVKTTAAVALSSGSDIDFTAAVTSKDKDEGRATGSKKTFAWKGIDDRVLFDGLDIADLSLGADFEVSGTDVTVAGMFAFTVSTKAFSAPAQVRVVILQIKGGSEVNGPGIELKVNPAPFKMKILGTEVAVVAECKASFIADGKKIGLLLGKKILTKMGKERLEKEAAKQGVKMLGREAGVQVLKELGPIAAAFSIGWDMGELLNAYTVAPKAAGMVYDDILGDLNEEYHRASTLGKLWLVSKNSYRIVPAMIAAGVVGAFAGMGDLLVFKLMGLDKLGDFGEAMVDFGRKVTVGMKAVREAMEDGVGGTMIYGALMLGIKSNPAHHTARHGALDPIMAALYRKLRPLYRKGGYSEVISVTIGSAQPDAAALAKFAHYVHTFKLTHGQQIDLASEAKVAASLLAMPAYEFHHFLVANKLIGYKVKVDGDMDPDDIDPKLLDELFA